MRVGSRGMTAESYTPDAARWDAFVEWARRFYEWGDFEEAETNYKVEAAGRLAAVRESFLNDDPDWRNSLHDVAGQPYLLYWAMTDTFRRFLASDESDSANAMQSLWAEGNATPRQRVRAFAEAMDVAGAGIRGYDNLGSFLLMALDVRRYPYYQYTPFNEAYSMTGYPRVKTTAEAAEKYGHAVDFLDEFIQQSTRRGLLVHDRLDAQSLVWCVTKENYFADEWPTDVCEALGAYRESHGDRTTSDGPASTEDPDWSALAARLFWEPDHLAEIVKDLEDKRQMVFYGPPGTGKTFVAKAIAAEYARVGGGSEIVQFHPSYSYEDFIEGYRPTLDGDQAGFRLTEGPLKRIAAEAAANPDATYVLVIDELNRGNVAKVFGELYFLLEYRDEAMTLQYSHEPFKLPPNLLFICTMNTADRSIALVDAALRRRFWFHGFFPDEPPIEGLLRRWLTENQPGAEWVADLVDRANEHLDDRDAAIGPSYFMGDAELDDERVRRIWRRAVRPYVEEQCYGEDEKLRSLEYDRLLSEISTGDPPSEQAPTSTDPGTGVEAAEDGDDAS
jgi:MoxR-like ATPase